MLTVLLTIATNGRLVMAGIRFVTDRQPPAALAMLHGFLAGAAVTLLMYAAATVGLPKMAVWALVLFTVAAAGGVILNLNYHLKQLLLPKWLMGAHATAMVAEFLLLLATGCYCLLLLGQRLWHDQVTIPVRCLS